MPKKIEKLFSFAKNHCGLFVSLVTYFILASWHFVRQGVVNFDEAYFAVVVRTFSSIAKTAISNPIALLGGDFFSRLAENYGNVYTAARPSYIIFSSFLGMVFPAEYATRLASFLAGGLAIVFFYRLLGLYGFSKRVCSAGSFLLALSPLFLLYSRIGLSQIFSAAFIVVAVFYLLRFWQVGDRKDIAKFAISLAILFMSHYNVAFFCFFLFFYACFAIWKRKGRKKDWLLFIFCVTILPLFWELVTRIGSSVAGNRLSSGQGVLAYSQEFFNQLLKAQVSEEKPFNQLFYYFNLFWSTEGFFVTALVLIGLIFVLKNFKKFEYQAVFIPFFFTFLLFIAGQLKFPRNLVSILPIFYWLAALGLVWLGQRLEKKTRFKKVIWVLLLALAILPHFWLYNSYLNIDTRAREVSGYIRDNYRPQDTIIVSWSTAIWRSYLPEYRSEQLAEPETWRTQLQQRPQLIIIEDYFTDILGAEKIYDIAEKKEVARFETNVFLVRPVIMDFIYKKPAVMEKIFSDNKNSQTIIYQYGTSMR